MPYLGHKSLKITFRKKKSRSVCTEEVETDSIHAPSRTVTQENGAFTDINLTSYYGVVQCMTCISLVTILKLFLRSL